MKMSLLQQALRMGGLYAGKIDGLGGPLTTAGVQLALQAANVSYEKWNAYRQNVGGLQSVLSRLGFNPGPVDGLWGPQTQFAAETFEEYLDTKEVPTPWRVDGLDNLPAPKPNKKAQPVGGWPRQGNASLRGFFGEPGQNQVYIEPPYAMRLAWDLGTKLTRFQCHEKVAAHMLWALEEVERNYSEQQRVAYGFDRFGGCLNVRQVRGGAALSTHAWGIAIDFDPDRNQLKWGRDKAFLAKPECETFRRIWKEAGALSLGEARNYDWMHFQFATL